jgi:hypothetical protein
LKEFGTELGKSHRREDRELSKEFSQFNEEIKKSFWRY